MSDFELLAESGNISAWYAEGRYHVAVGDEISVFETSQESSDFYAVALLSANHFTLH